MTRIVAFLFAGVLTTSCVSPGTDSRTTVFRDKLKDGSLGPEMVSIPAGQFRMGDLSGDMNGYWKPVHQVTITNSFALGKYEVTFTEYDAFARATYRSLPKDQGWGRGKRPVIYVSWEDATAYAKWLSKETGKQYRLPSEAEWEYAARAGSTTKHHFGNEERELCEYANGADQSTDYGWRNKACDDGYGKKTAPVGSFLPNQSGLYDMHGNVYEWVEDCYHDSYQGAPTNGSAWTNGNCGFGVLRGGTWLSGPAGLRSAVRGRNSRANRDFSNGFRLAQNL